MEKEQKKKIRNLKAKGLATLISLLLCFLLIGISVYAALQQTANYTDNLTVSTSGHVEVAVNIYQQNGAANNTLLAGETGDYATISGLSYGTALLSKTSLEAGKTATGLNPVFSYTNGYTYTSYKIVLTNESADTAASYVITTPSSLNSQFTIFYADTAIATNAILSGSLAVAGTTTIYIVVALNTETTALTAAAAADFVINIQIDPAS